MLKIDLLEQPISEGGAREGINPRNFTPFPYPSPLFCGSRQVPCGKIGGILDLDSH
jgi:hypothetical protein